MREAQDYMAVKNYPFFDGFVERFSRTRIDNDIPAMLSDGEFVFTARAVRGMGDGSRRKGAKRMYAMMKKLENRANG